MTLEAARIALKYMTPVMFLTDGYIGQASEPWRIPEIDNLPEMLPHFANDPSTFKPYLRNPETLARHVGDTRHARHGTPHWRIEKEDGSGVVSHDPMNHQKMIELRQKKVDNIANDIPELEVIGEQEGDLLLLSWGSTYGAAKIAVEKLRHKAIKSLTPFAIPESIP